MMRADEEAATPINEEHRTTFFPPTPSLRSMTEAEKFKYTLMVLLVINCLFYFFGAFGSGGDISAVDLLLVFIGYYAQDIYRPGAIQLYYCLTALSVVMETIVMVIRMIYYANTSSFWVVVVDFFLYFFETVAKVFSVYFAYNLCKLLESTPSQTAEGY